MDKQTYEKKTEFGEVLDLVEKLFSKDGMRRRRAREQLEKKGHKVTPLLIGALKSENTDVRWEAAKALINIKDPLAANALTESMMDEDYEVRWLAAEALIELEEEAIIPLLRELLGHYDSLYLRKGAHHVLEILRENNRLNEETLRVLEELGSVMTPEPYPLTAKKVLESLLKRKAEPNSLEKDTIKKARPTTGVAQGK